MDNSLKKHTNRLTRRALVFLYWEKYAPVFAISAFAWIVFLGLAGFGLWQRIGDPWRFIGLGIVLFLSIKAVLQAQKITRPNISQAKRRVEQDNNLPHRPLDVIDDELAFKHDMDKQAWRVFKQKATEQTLSARAPKLRPSLSLIDKYKLRFIAPIAFILALMVGFGDNYERLRGSILPVWQYGMNAKTVQYEAWIDPPEYTARPPAYFKNKTKISAPAGSEFVVRITGARQAPRLILKSGAKTKRIKAKRLGKKSFEARYIIEKPTLAYFRIGKNEKKWRIDTKPDTAPKINFVDLPKADKRDRLVFSYNLQDDFGVKQIVLSLSPVLSPEEVDEITITLAGFNVRKAEKEPASVNLTKHKWAGEKVKGRLLAVDGKNQIGSSKIVEFIVPDKVFVEPLAKAIAEQRRLVLKGSAPYKPLKPLPKQTITDLKNKPLFSYDRPERAVERAPKQIQRAAELIDAVSYKPVGIFEDPAVYMGLRNVYHRLQRAKNQNDLSGIAEDLWSIAIRAEFGKLGDALEDMRRAQRALNNAMARRAPQREIDVLFERYNQAVDRYIEQLTLEAAKKAMQQTDGQSGDMDARSVDQIQELLDAIEEANRRGDSIAARKALKKLAELLENMKIQMAQGGGGEGSSLGEGMSDELRQALEELNDALGKERKLRDQTRDAARRDADNWEKQGEEGADNNSNNNNDGKGKTPSKNDLAEQQKEIAKMIEDLQNMTDTNNGKSGAKPGEEKQGKNGADGGNNDDDKNNIVGGGIGDEDIKNALDKALRSMDKSADALARGEFYEAGEAQSDAIDALRAAGEKLLKQEADRIAKQAKQDGSGQEAGRDPFGRDGDNGDGGGGVGESDIEVPEISDRERARELLELLRKRAGESDRNQIEREYLERLLDQF